MKFHILYTLDNEVSSEIKEFESFQLAEDWLEGIGATYWEIGISQEAFNKTAYLK